MENHQQQQQQQQYQQEEEEGNELQQGAWYADSLENNEEDMQQQQQQQQDIEEEHPMSGSQRENSVDNDNYGGYCDSIAQSCRRESHKELDEQQQNQQPEKIQKDPFLKDVSEYKATKNNNSYQAKLTTWGYPQRNQGPGESELGREAWNQEQQEQDKQSGRYAHSEQGGEYYNNNQANARFQEGREEQQQQLRERGDQEEEGDDSQPEKIVCQQDEDDDDDQHQMKSKQERTQSLNLEQKGQTTKDYSYSVQSLSNVNKNKKNNNSNTNPNSNQTDPKIYENAREKTKDNTNKSAIQGSNNAAIGISADGSRAQQLEYAPDENNNNNTYQQDSLESFRSKGPRRYVSKSTEQPPIQNEQDFIDDNYLYYFRNSQDEEDQTNQQQQREMEQIDQQKQQKQPSSFSDQSRRSLEALKQAEKIKDLFSASINKKELYRWVDGSSSRTEATYLAQLLQLRDSGQISPTAFDFQALIEQHNNVNNIANENQRVEGSDKQNIKDVQGEKSDDHHDDKDENRQQEDILKEEEDIKMKFDRLLLQGKESSSSIVKENDNGMSKGQKKEELSVEVLTPQQKNMLIIGDNQMENNNAIQQKKNNKNNIVVKQSSARCSSSGSSQSVPQQAQTLSAGAQKISSKKDVNENDVDQIDNQQQDLISLPRIEKREDRDLREIRYSNNQEELERELQKEQEEDELVLRTCSRSLRDVLAANNINSSSSSKKEERGAEQQISSNGVVVLTHGRSGSSNGQMQLNNQLNQQDLQSIPAAKNYNNNLFGRSMNLLQNRKERQAELDRLQEQNQQISYNRNDNRLYEGTQDGQINQLRHGREYLLFNEQGQGEIIDQYQYDNYDDEEKQMNVRYDHGNEDDDDDEYDDDYYAYIEQDDDEEYPLHHLYPPKISEENILTPQNRQSRNWRKEVVRGEDQEDDDDEEEGQIYPKSLDVGGQQINKKKKKMTKKNGKKISSKQQEQLIRRRQQQLELQKQQELQQRQQYGIGQQQLYQQDQNMFVNEIHENHWQKHPQEDEDEDTLHDHQNNNNTKYDSNLNTISKDNLMFNYNSIEDYGSNTKNDQQLYQQQQQMNNHRNTILEYSQSSAKNPQALLESQISRQLYTDSKHTREEILEEEKDQQSPQQIQQQQKEQQQQQYQQNNNRLDNEGIGGKQRLSIKGKTNDIQDMPQKSQTNSNNGSVVSSKEQQVSKPCRIKVDLFRNLTQPINQQKDISAVPPADVDMTTTATAGAPSRIPQNIYDYTNNTFGRQSNSIQSSYIPNNERLPDNQLQYPHLGDSHKIHKSQENLALLYPEQVQNIAELSKRVASKYLSERQTNNHANSNNSNQEQMNKGIQREQQQQQQQLVQDLIDEQERMESAEYRAEVEILKNSTRQQQLQHSSEKNPYDHSRSYNNPASLLNRLDYQYDLSEKRQEQLTSQQASDLQALDAKYSAITQVQTQTSSGITARQLLLTQQGDTHKSRQLSMGDTKNMNILQLNQHLLSTVSKRQKKQRDQKNYQSFSVFSSSKSQGENIMQNNSKIGMNGGQQKEQGSQRDIGGIKDDINNNSNGKRSLKNYNSRLSYPAINNNIPNSLNNSSLSLSQGYQPKQQYQSTSSLISQQPSNGIPKQPSQTLYHKDNLPHTASMLSYPGRLIQFSLADTNSPGKMSNIYKNNATTAQSNPLLLQSNSIEFSPLKSDLNSLMRPSKQIITPFNLDQQERQCLQLIAQQNITAAQTLLTLLENHINATFPPKNTHRTFMYYLNARIEQLLSHNQSALTFCERGLSEISKDQLYFDVTLFKYAFTLRQMAQKEAECLQKLPQQLQHLRSMAEMIEFGLDNKDRVDFNVADISGQYAGKYLVEIYKTLAKIARALNDHRACSQYLIKAQQRLNTEMDFDISTQLIEALIACDQKGEAILELKSQLAAISNNHNNSLTPDHLDHLKLNSLDILSNLYYEINDFSSSLSTLEQSYNLKARIHGIADSRTSMCQFLIAQVHMKLANMRQASKLFASAISLLDKSLGEQNIYSANGLLSLAEIAKNEGGSSNNYSESMRYYEQARKRYKLLCGEDSFVCLVIILNELYLACKIAAGNNNNSSQNNSTHTSNYSQNHIQSLFHEIIQLTAHSSNRNAADAINILNEAANILRNHKFLPQALEAYVQAKSLSNHHSQSQTSSQDINIYTQDLLITMNIASTYELMGILDKAISYFEDSLEITQNIQNTSAYAVKIHSCLGRIYKSLWKNSEAVYHFKQALGMISNKEGYVEEKMELRKEIQGCQKSR